MANSLYKPIPEIKGIEPLNTEMVDGMAQQAPGMGQGQGPSRQGQAAPQKEPQKTALGANGASRIKLPTIGAGTIKLPRVDLKPRLGESLPQGGYQAPSSQILSRDSGPTGALESTLNWGKTQLSDLWSIVEGIPTIVAQAWRSYASGAPSYALEDIARFAIEDPSEVAKVSQDVMKHIFLGSYENEKGELEWGSFFKQAKNHTALTLLDALGVVGLTGSVTAKTAGLASKMKLGSTMAQTGRAAGVAGRLEHLGSSLLKLESAPYNLIGAGLSKLEKVPPIRWIEEKLAITPLNRMMARKKGEFHTDAQAAAREDQMRLALREIPRDQWKEFADLQDLHNIGSVDRWTPAMIGKAKEWFRQNKLANARREALNTFQPSSGHAANSEMVAGAQTRKIAMRHREETMGLGAEQEVLTPGLGGAVVSERKFVVDPERTIAKLMEGDHKFWDTPEGASLIEQLNTPLTDAELMAARLTRENNIAALKARGFDDADWAYRPWAEEGGLGFDEVLESLGSPADLSLKRKLTSLERAVGRPLQELDPEVWSSRAMAARTALDAEGRFVQWVSSELGELLPGGTKPKDGFVAMPQYLGQYFRHMDMAASKIAQGKIPAIQAALSRRGLTPDMRSASDVATRAAFLEVADEVSQMVDSDWRSLYKNINNDIQVPKDVARFLEMEMQRAGGFGQLWDYGMNKWKKILFLMPRFYANNIIGNTILTILHGADPFVRGSRNMDNVPADVNRALLSMADSGGLLSVMNHGKLVESFRARRVLRRMEDIKRKHLDIPQDAIFRQAVYDRELAKALDDRDRLTKLAAIFGEDRLAELKGTVGAMDAIVQDARQQMLTADTDQFARMSLSEAELKMGAADAADALAIRLSHTKDDLLTQKAALEMEVARLAAFKRHAAMGRTPAYRMSPEGERQARRAFGPQHQNVMLVDLQAELQPMVAKLDAMRKRVESLTRQEAHGVRLVESQTPENIRRGNRLLDSLNFQKAQTSKRFHQMLARSQQISERIEAIKRMQAVGESVYDDLDNLDVFNALDVAERYGLADEDIALLSRLINEGADPVFLSETASKAVGRSLASDIAQFDDAGVLPAAAAGLDPAIAGAFRPTEGDMARANAIKSLRDERKLWTPEERSAYAASFEKEFARALDLESRSDLAALGITAPSKAERRLSQINEELADLASKEARLAARQQSRSAYSNRLIDAALNEPELAKLRALAEPVEHAIAEMETFFGAYGKLTPFERKYIRRWISPFWTFQKTMFQLLWRYPLIRPGRTAILHRLGQMALESIDDDRLPHRLKNSILLGTTADGRMIFARLGGINPLEWAGFRELGGVPIPRMLDPMNNPLVSVIHRMDGGHDTFSQPAPLEEGLQFRDAFGRVWQWDAVTGTSRLVTPGKSMLNSVLELFPQASIVADISASVGLKTHGIGPKIYQGPDGKVINPRHWSWAIMRSMGMPMEGVDLTKMRYQERLQRYLQMKDMAKAVLRLRRRQPAGDDNDEAEQSLKVLRDMMRHPEFKMVR